MHSYFVLMCHLSNKSSIFLDKYIMLYSQIFVNLFISCANSKSGAQMSTALIVFAAPCSFEHEFEHGGLF